MTIVCRSDLCHFRRRCHFRIGPANASVVNFGNRKQHGLCSNTIFNTTRFATIELITPNELGREPINLPGGRLAKVSYAPIAIKICSAAR